MKSFVLCLDDVTLDILNKLNIQQIKCIPLKEVENKDLLSAKKNRSNTEYCWTLASSFTWYVLNKNLKIDLITYLDADLLFFSDLSQFLKKLEIHQ